jgi:hypothetical protein
MSAISRKILPKIFLVTVFLMEVGILTMVAMSKPTKKNLQLPLAIDLLFNQMVGDKKQWMVLSAAILVFAEINEEQRRGAIGRIAVADATGDFDALVDPLAKKLAQGSNERMRMAAKKTSKRPD